MTTGQRSRPRRTVVADLDPGARVELGLATIVDLGRGKIVGLGRGNRVQLPCT